MALSKDEILTMDSRVTLSDHNTIPRLGKILFIIYIFLYPLSKVLVYGEVNLVKFKLSSKKLF